MDVSKILAELNE